MPRFKFTVFHLFYSTTFTLLSLLLLALILVPPSDAIQQTLRKGKRQIYNPFLIAGVYVLTAVLAIILYTGRMYTVRRLLADIPKPLPPVSRNQLPKRIHAAVTRGASRSAAIALQARPKQGGGVWGEINHPGWAPPGGDLGGVEYMEILEELPGLVEREAEQRVRERQVVHRPVGMTFKGWVENLVTMEIAPRTQADEFVVLYERARFRRRGVGIAEREFRELMRALKGLLEGIRNGGDVWRNAGDAESTGGSVRRDPQFSTQQFPPPQPQFSMPNYGGAGYETSSSVDYGSGYTPYEGEGYTPERVNTMESFTPERINIAGSAVRTATGVGVMRPHRHVSSISGASGETFEMDSMTGRRGDG
ncbi:hypothetical protein FN846DRAFT_936967 [Sphaerosporella brunnea]|uniref:Defect at low temperature protein 1 n=1 Tax=Sphaerosporella brunnea TaxID=1250544 RepID=A0A5J5F3T9_9PEZI|nr:hypothetical protein FN846DRAFT_936967 [Sphaerosporella brunnea]